jgi:hypothetical protein
VADDSDRFIFRYVEFKAHVLNAFFELFRLEFPGSIVGSRFLTNAAITDDDFNLRVLIRSVAVTVNVRPQGDCTLIHAPKTIEQAFS